MTVSVFDLFSIGVGPSSSHTVGPMRAARQFALHLHAQQLLSPSLHTLVVDLYGSLALTGKGHATDIAVLLGLEGESPEAIEPDRISKRVDTIRQQAQLCIAGSHPLSFREEEHLLFHYDKQLPYHPNGMRLTAFDRSNRPLEQKIYYSVGGGFVVEHSSALQSSETAATRSSIPYPFTTGDELLRLCRLHRLTIAQLMMANECVSRSEAEVKQRLIHIWNVMQASVRRGCQSEGILPGGLNVKRRAPGMLRSLTTREQERSVWCDPAEVMDWVSLWALAVNEENAAGGRVVTAPTNGAAGVIPSILHYYQKFVPGASEEGIVTFLLTAGAIGILYKEGASISAAEMGCMGEVGVACSMAAAGLAAVLGGSNEQIENAAEIGIEHNLGLTCDPVGGLVQIPCIERNTMGANKAINAARLACFHGDGQHRVSLDQGIATMKQTGRDMMSLYKETSQGGLAVNVPAC